VFDWSPLLCEEPEPEPVVDPPSAATEVFAGIGGPTGSRVKREFVGQIDNVIGAWKKST
jgi:hypothetical protein